MGMGFNPLKLLGAAAETIGSIFGLDLSSVTDALSSGNLTPEQRTQLQAHEVRLKELALEELQTEIEAKVDLMKAEIASDDKFVKRARPTGLYIYYLAVVALVVAMIFGADLDTGAMLTLLAPLAGYSGWYTYQRSQDKKVAMNGGR